MPPDVPLPPPPAPPRPCRALTAALALGLAASIALALLPGPTALFPALTDLARDVAAHDSESLRREHDGWYARLLPVYEAVAALPEDEPLLVAHDQVPPFFVAARFPARRVFAASDALRAELDAHHQPYHVLTLANGDPLRWTLLPGDEAGR
ncbi:MAG TPA: hypothetical protein VK824_01040 [Planctomycetota bacterium]|nr:hypothetical protein [Planctomycetota bacterium]